MTDRREQLDAVYDQPPTGGCENCGSTAGLGLGDAGWLCADCFAAEAAEAEAREPVESEEEVNDRIKVGYGANSGRVILTINGCRHTLGRRGEARVLGRAMMSKAGEAEAAARYGPRQS